MGGTGHGIAGVKQLAKGTEQLCETAGGDQRYHFRADSEGTVGVGHATAAARLSWNWWPSQSLSLHCKQACTLIQTGLNTENETPLRKKTLACVYTLLHYTVNGVKSIF